MDAERVSKAVQIIHSAGEHRIRWDVLLARLVAGHDQGLTDDGASSIGKIRTDVSIFTSSSAFLTSSPVDRAAASETSPIIATNSLMILWLSSRTRRLSSNDDDGFGSKQLSTVCSSFKDTFKQPDVALDPTISLPSLSDQRVSRIARHSLC